MSDFSRRPIVFQFRSYPFARAMPLRGIDDYYHADMMLPLTRLDVEQTHSLGRILRRILEHETVLRREGFIPTTVILGQTLYLQLLHQMRDHPACRMFAPPANQTIDLDTHRLYGMAIVCDPRVEPQSVYVVPAPDKAAFYGEPIRILNLEATRASDAYDAAHPDQLT